MVYDKKQIQLKEILQKERKNWDRGEVWERDLWTQLAIELMNPQQLWLLLQDWACQPSSVSGGGTHEGWLLAEELLCSWF